MYVCKYVYFNYSPILWVAEYKFIEYIDGSPVAVCLTQALNGWTITYFVASISIFFVLPLFLLIILYGIIAKHLISSKGNMMLRIRPAKPELSQKARKQVVFMLGTVVLSFFLCLLPFRMLTLWIILSSDHTMLSMGVERYYSFLYFCRLMLYLNSAINPLLYNLMSTKFRKGFLQLLKTCTVQRQSYRTNRRKNVLTTCSANNIVTNTSSSILTRSSQRRISDENYVKSFAEPLQQQQQQQQKQSQQNKYKNSMNIEDAEVTSMLESSAPGTQFHMNEIVIQLKGIKRLNSKQQQQQSTAMVIFEKSAIAIEHDKQLDIEMEVEVEVEEIHQMMQLAESDNCDTKRLTFNIPELKETAQI